MFETMDEPARHGSRGHSTRQGSGDDVSTTKVPATPAGQRPASPADLAAVRQRGVAQPPVQAPLPGTPAAPAAPLTASTTGPITGAESLVRSLELAGVEVVFGIPAARSCPGVRPAVRLVEAAPHPVRHEQGAGTPPRATRRRPAGSASAWPPPGRAPPTSYADRRRLHGLRAAGRHHRAGAERPIGTDASRRPTSSHHDADHQAQLPRAVGRASRAPSPRRSTSPAPAAPGPCSSTSPRTSCRAAGRSPWPPALDLPG
jgi:acetolactate synthase-1/2/3 large subunit